MQSDGGRRVNERSHQQTKTTESRPIRMSHTCWVKLPGCRHGNASTQVPCESVHRPGDRQLIAAGLLEVCDWLQNLNQNQYS